MSVSSRLLDLPIPISLPPFRYMSASIQRPADTNIYAANDAFADSTTVPTAGGFVLAVNTAERLPNVGAAVQPAGNLSAPFSGGGIINDAIIVASASTAYQGELWLFERPVTAINDNAAFAISDAEALSLIGIMPFLTNDTTSNNAVSYVQDFGGIGFACDPGNIRMLVKIMNTPTPASAEVLSVRLKFQPLRSVGS